MRGGGRAGEHGGERISGERTDDHNRGESVMMTGDMRMRKNKRRWSGDEGRRQERREERTGGWGQLREGQGGGVDAGRRREDTESTESSRHEVEQAESREREEVGTRRRRTATRERSVELHVVFRHGFQAVFTSA